MSFLFSFESDLKNFLSWRLMKNLCLGQISRENFSRVVLYILIIQNWEYFFTLNLLFTEFSISNVATIYMTPTNSHMANSARGNIFSCTSIAVFSRHLPLWWLGLFQYNCWKALQPCPSQQSLSLNPPIHETTSSPNVFFSLSSQGLILF